MDSFLYGNSNAFHTKSFLVFTFVKTLNLSPAQDLTNKKNCSSLRLRWVEIFFQQFTNFWRTCAILWALTVITGCVILRLKHCIDIALTAWRALKDCHLIQVTLVPEIIITRLSLQGIHSLTRFLVHLSRGGQTPWLVGQLARISDIRSKVLNYRNF